MGTAQMTRRDASKSKAKSNDRPPFKVKDLALDEWGRKEIRLAEQEMPGLMSTREEYWWCTEQALVWPDGSGPNMLLDDGGDATLLVHKGAEFEKAGKIPAFDSKNDPEEWGVILDLLRAEAKNHPDRWTRVAKDIK